MMYATVRKFAIEMNRELTRNQSRGGWRHEDTESLIRRIRNNIQEVDDAFLTPSVSLLKPLVDVANLAMMIADNTGELRYARRRR